MSPLGALSTMREFAFALAFERSTHPVADLFIEEDLRLRLVQARITDERVRRLDHLVGDDAAVATAIERLTDPRCNECLGTRTCGGGASYDPFDADESFLYTDRPLRRSCHSVARVVADTLGAGTVATADWHGDRYRWRLPLPDGDGDEDGVGLLYDALPARLRDGVSFRFEHLRAPDGWPVGTVLPPQQRRAVERGFYETSRETNVTELATALGIPRSTLTYRLRRAEARMATALVQPDASR